jgi:GNAT superfamily N-acetyltransferase
MRPGRREFKQASLTVAIPEALPAHMREHTREITHVFVPHAHRSQRLATALLNFVCQEADANKITLILTAQRVEDAGGASVSGNDTAAPNTAQLIAWYQQFGFVKLQDTEQGAFMARQVRERPRIKPIRLAISRALH